MPSRFLTKRNSGIFSSPLARRLETELQNLKPETVGYKTAWDHLKKEYGQTKVVVNAHMDEIINLFPVKGSKYFRVQEFYEKLSRNCDTLQTLEEGQKLQGFIMTTLNKLPHVKLDLVRVDENWEEEMSFTVISINICKMIFTVAQISLIFIFLQMMQLCFIKINLLQFYKQT